MRPLEAAAKARWENHRKRFPSAPSWEGVHSKIDQAHQIEDMRAALLAFADSQCPREELLPHGYTPRHWTMMRQVIKVVADGEPLSEVAAFPIIRDDSPPGGFSEVTVTIEVHAEDRLGLLEALIRAIENREIPPEECFGSFGWDASPLPVSGVVWSHDNRLHPEMAVIWHRRAIVPPALVLDPKAIIYGRVGHSMMARYRQSEAA